ncbi:MAG: DUF4153 domain-containing protein [Parvularculaceae bacterium]
MGGADKKPGGGFALFGLMVGLAAGLAVYGITEFWIGEASNAPVAQTVLLTVASFAAAFLLLSERGATLRAVLPAAVIALILAYPTYSSLKALDEGANLTAFPAVFWFVAGLHISGFLMTTLAKASLLERAPPPYSAVFFHGLTLPLIAAGAYFFAILASVLLFAWALLLRSLDVDFFHRVFQEPWFMLPFFGAVGGLSIAMMRGLESVLGALRFILLLFSRITMLITAVFSVTFLAVLAIKGPMAIFIGPTPGAFMLGLAFIGMLIFNGVYQNGEGEPPPAWLRLPTIITLLAFPVYSGLAAYAFWLRVEDYGLTPPRVIGLAMNGLAAAYSIVCLAGILSEFNWTGKRWMPLVAPLNTLMAVIWVIVLILLATPVLDPWAMSARNQVERLLDGRAKASEFDYGYLRFSLGRHGERALERLVSSTDYPDYAVAHAGVARARAASSQWEYKQGAPKPAEAVAPPSEDTAGPQPGPMDLPLDPGESDPPADSPADADAPSGGDPPPSNN